MHRFLCRHFLSARLAFACLIAAVILPFASIASGAAPDTSCTPSEGGSYCHLDISAPQSVPAGQAFTVKVSVMTGFEGGVVAKSDFCASKVVVTLDVISGESVVASYTSQASGGVATFTITLSPAGSYSLDAFVDLGESSTDSCGNHYLGDTADVAATNVPAGQPIYPCPDNASCDQTTSGSGSAATLFANDGSFTAAFSGHADLCGDGGPLDPNGVLTFNYAGSSTKTIVLALSPALVTKGIGQYKICYQSTNPFTPLGGGAPVNVGFLGNCSKDFPPPCVLFKTGTQHDGAFFGISAPQGDPQAYPGQ